MDIDLTKRRRRTVSVYANSAAPVPSQRVIPPSTRCSAAASAALAEWQEELRADRCRRTIKIPKSQL